MSDSEAEYNALGKTLRATAYDLSADGNRKIASEALDRTVKYDWNADGSLARSYDPEGNYTTHSYDQLGRTASVRDPLGNEVRFFYDRRSLAVRKDMVGNDGKTVSTYSAYDADGRLVAESQLENGTLLQTSYSYDGLGNVTKKTDPESRETAYSYDLAGRLVSETDSSSGTVSYAYDDDGKRTSMTDSE